MDCLFCSIIKGDIPSNKIYDDEKIYAFMDIAPEAPVHFLVVPKTHIAGANDVNAENSDVIAHIFATIPKICADLGVTNGYRIINNCGEDGGQTVGHMHFHVLAGRSLAWPPG
ncbi:MAG: histidine triad nucleotide-binding protein [Clostridia bacterium]